MNKKGIGLMEDKLEVAVHLNFVGLLNSEKEKASMKRQTV